MIKLSLPLVSVLDKIRGVTSSFFIDILLHSVNPKNNSMAVKHVVAEIHDLLIRIYGEGLSKKEKKEYEKLSEKDLEDLRVKLKLRL